MKDTDKVNEYYKSVYTEEQVVEQLINFTSVQRKDRCSIGTIRKAYQNDTLGKLIKKMDPQAFYCIIKEI